MLPTLLMGVQCNHNHYSFFPWRATAPDFKLELEVFASKMSYLRLNQIKRQRIHHLVRLTRNIIEKDFCKGYVSLSCLGYLLASFLKWSPKIYYFAIRPRLFLSRWLTIRRKLRAMSQVKTYIWLWLVAKYFTPGPLLGNVQTYALYQSLRYLGNMATLEASIARAFEKAVYVNLIKTVVESHLCDTQHAYRERGVELMHYLDSTTNI